MNSQATLPVTDAQDANDITLSMSLGGVQVRYRLWWRPRLSRWYMRLYTPDGTLVSDWHPVGPEALATHDTTAPGHPPGLILATGTGNGDRRSDLFTSMTLTFVPFVTS